MNLLESEPTISIFGINAIPNTSLIRRYAVRCVSKTQYIRCCIYFALCFRNQNLELMQSQIQTEFGDMLCVVFPNSLNPMTSNIEFIRCCVSKMLKGAPTDIVNQCFEICSLIPLTMNKSLLLIFSLL